MCFNPKVSIITFIIGVISSLFLMNSNTNEYAVENKITGIFFIFIAMIQLMDFLFWIDINNKIGINKITTIIGPILNVCQPVILYLITKYYIDTKENKYDLPVKILNIMYMIYFINIYYKFITTDSLITGTFEGHLQWPWLKYKNAFLYLALLAVNIFFATKFKYSIILFSITYMTLILSKIYFSYHVGEMWCFFGAFIPIIIYIISNYFDKSLLK